MPYQEWSSDAIDQRTVRALGVRSVVTQCLRRMYVKRKAACFVSHGSRAIAPTPRKRTRTMPNSSTPPDDTGIPEDEDRPLTQGEKHAQAMQMAAPVDQTFLSRQIGGPRRYEHKLRTDMLTIPPPTYQAENITSLEGYDEHGAGLSLAVSAFEAMNAAVASIIEARRKSDLDPTLHNEKAKVLKVSLYSDKLTETALKQADAAHRTIQAQIKVVQGELQRAVEASTTSQLATEIRAHCKSQPSAVQFVSQLIASRDARSVSAVLGAPAFLSGLTEEMKTALTHKWNAERDPTLTGKLSLLEKASERLERAGALLPATMERAMGVKYPLINRLRAEQAAAAFG